MRLITISILFACVFITFSCSKLSVETNNWRVFYNSEDKGVTIEKGSKKACDNLYASYILNGDKISTKDYSKVKCKEVKFEDTLGSGTAFIITYKQSGLPTLVQTFYIYPERDYILTEFTLDGGQDGISSNYMAPLNLDNIDILQKSKDNRALFIPFDNDCWIRYQSHPLVFDELTSYEVTAVFDNESRNGIVVGSVEHDYWKSAVKMTSITPGGSVSGNASDGLKSLICYGGVADTLTRDSKAHGALSGKTIKSPKVMFGVFDDWRAGLEEYALANAAIAPPKAWTKSVPFGWNSWGALQFKLTFQKAMEVSDFYKDNLQNNGFVSPDNTVYIGLDSGWDVFSEEELKAFVQKCRENGQIAAIYWTPFTDWGKRPEATIREARDYKFKDVYLYANGKPQELDGAYAIDPTHPAIETRMKTISEKFRRCGFEYVKMDFMTHGAMEADKWYNPEMQTGIQAYNYGMQLLNKYFGDMYLNLSISPIFPAQYAQSRRIACDAWNAIKDTEYTMNAVSYGWWVEKVYQYNDADHVVLRDVTEGENRARVTSSVITGLYIAGDDYSLGGAQDAKDKSLKFLTNKAINKIANGITFRPVEGNGEKSEYQFMRVEDNGMYYVCFNYGEDEATINVPFDRLGLDKSVDYNTTELWSGETVDIKNSLTVAAKDVIVLFVANK